MKTDPIIKTEEYKEYTVREHKRRMFKRVYKFVCTACGRKVERETFAVCCPSYGNKCNGIKSDCHRAKN